MEEEIANVVIQMVRAVQFKLQLQNVLVLERAPSTVGVAYCTLTDVHMQYI